MTEPSHELEALLAAERVLSTPSAGDRARNRRALARQLGLAAVLSSGVAQGSALFGVKFVSTVLLVAAGSGTTAWLVSRQGAQHDQPAAVSSSMVDERPRPAASSAPAFTAGAAASVTGPPSPAHVVPKPATEQRVANNVEPGASVRAFPSDNGDPLAAETQLVGQAQAALRSGRAARALELLGQAARQFPSGALQEETSASRVLALCQLGRHDEARAAANDFGQRFPKSLLAVQVRKSCVGSAFP